MNKIMPLIIKDLTVLKSSRKSLLTIMLIYIVLIILNKDSNDILTIASMMIIFMFTLFATSTFSYDEKNNTDKYVLTLPVKKKSVIKAKYFLLILSILLGSLISIVFSLIAGSLNLITISSYSDYFASLLGLVWAMSILIAVEVPCIYKFGAEKGRLSMYIVFMAIAAICAFGTLLFPNIDLSFLDKLEKFIPFIGIGIIILNIAISYLISKKIYLKREV